MVSMQSFSFMEGNREKRTEKKNLNIVGIGLKIYESRFLVMNENSRIGIFTNCCSKEGDKNR